MAAVDQMELDVGRTAPEALHIMPGDIRGVVLVPVPSDVQDGRADGLIVALVPIARQTAADGDGAANGLGAGCGEAIVQRDGLREAEQQAPIRWDA